MKGRTTAVLVTVAVVAGAAVAGVGLATSGSSKPRPVLRIDEVHGLVGTVVLGETRQNVIGALGAPASSVRDGSFLRYRHLVVRLVRGRVDSVETDDPSAETDRVVRVGDPLSAVRAAYRKASACNPNSPDKSAKHPRCRVTVPAGHLLIGGDPIRTITLAR